jgi:hypothetical protein
LKEKYNIFLGDSGGYFLFPLFLSSWQSKSGTKKALFNTYFLKSFAKMKLI